MTNDNSTPPAPSDEARDAYLWDPKAAPPVDDVAALERALAPLSSAKNPATAPRVVRKPRARQVSIAATLAIAASIAIVLKVRAPDDVVIVEGNARRSVAVGEAIRAERETTLELGPHGVVTLAAGSELSVVQNARARQELALAKGSLSAVVVAPPRFFTVTTQAARAVDMGCAYELSVDDAGATTLSVTSGFVALEGPESGDKSKSWPVDVLVPAGASARALPNAPPGLPFRTDATPALRAVLDARALDVDALLANTDARDAITLWYALTRIDDGRDHARVLERLIAVSPPPASVDVAAVRKGDVDAMHAWRDAIEDALTPWPTHAFP